MGTIHDQDPVVSASQSRDPVFESSISTGIDSSHPNVVTQSDVDVDVRPQLQSRSASNSSDVTVTDAAFQDHHFQDPSASPRPISLASTSNSSSSTLCPLPSLPHPQRRRLDSTSLSTRNALGRRPYPSRITALHTNPRDLNGFYGLVHTMAPARQESPATERWISHGRGGFGNLRRHSVSDPKPEEQANHHVNFNNNNDTHDTSSPSSSSPVRRRRRSSVWSLGSSSNHHHHTSDTIANASTTDTQPQSRSRRGSLVKMAVAMFRKDSVSLSVDTGEHEREHERERERARRMGSNGEVIEGVEE